jgi:hypothetical protein
VSPSTAEYVMLVGGQIGPRTARALGPVSVVGTDATGTHLTGRFADQAELHGVLERIRDLGLELVEVRRIA